MLIEEWLYFNQYAFHVQKLIFHRASMQYYKHFLTKAGYRVDYIESAENNQIANCIENWKLKGINTIHYVNTIDNWLEKRLMKAAAKHNIRLKAYDSPSFINTSTNNNLFFANKKRFFQTDFYVWQRKRLNILLEEKEKPTGGKWTFDTENRLKIPANHSITPTKLPDTNEYVEEAINYVTKHFPNNPGLSAQKIPYLGKINYYPISHTAAEIWLEKFIDEKLALFGIYEDAMVAGESFLYHSILTPMLNTGLITPQQVIDRVLIKANDANLPINSVEGFVRQIIGWREFIRAVYEIVGCKQRTTNYWQFTRKIPNSFYTGKTGILPIDDVIGKLIKTGYNHHIERLMVLGNFMLLCEFDPNDVYQWFMEMYIDSYDWVMVPNVYGMTQFADGGLMTTKPYISGSNYLKKMSNYTDKGQKPIVFTKELQATWSEVWDALFWRFMHKQRAFFSSNPRLGMLLKTFDKMPPIKQQFHLQVAEAYLAKLDSETNITSSLEF